MKSRTLMFTTPTLFAALTIPAGLAAQDQDDKPKHHHYKLIDLGTFGGPSGYLALNNTANGAVNQVLNNQGAVVGWGDTQPSIPLLHSVSNHFRGRTVSSLSPFSGKKVF